MPMRQVTRGDMGEQIITIEQVSFEPIPEAEFTPPAEILKQIEAKAAMPGK